MDEIKQAKYIVFLEGANELFKEIASNKVFPILYNGYWTLAIPRMEAGHIRRLDPVTIRITQLNSKGNSTRTDSFYYEYIADYLFIKPV